MTTDDAYTYSARQGWLSPERLLLSMLVHNSWLEPLLIKRTGWFAMIQMTYYLLAGAGLILTGTFFAFDASSFLPGSIDAITNGSQFWRTKCYLQTAVLFKGTTPIPITFYQKNICRPLQLKESYDFTSLKEGSKLVKTKPPVTQVLSQASEVESDGQLNLQQRSHKILEKIEEIVPSIP